MNKIETLSRAFLLTLFLSALGAPFVFTIYFVYKTASLLSFLTVLGIIGALLALTCYLKKLNERNR